MPEVLNVFEVLRHSPEKALRLSSGAQLTSAARLAGRMVMTTRKIKNIHFFFP